MASAIPQRRLNELVRAARDRTGVPLAAVAVHAEDRTVLSGAHDRPFRIASITKSFTATAVSLAGLLDDRRRILLSHMAGYRPECAEPLPPECAGLWSYSNAGYWEAASVFGGDYSEAVREFVLEPLGLRSTGFETPPDAVLGTLPGHIVADPSYPLERRPSGGLWSTVGDLIEYGLVHCDEWAHLHQPLAEALGAQYGLGWWIRDGVLDHEGSVGGFQSLLLLAPRRRLVLAVLTNSWKGSALIRHIVAGLSLVPDSLALPHSKTSPPETGRYALDGDEAVVSAQRGGLRISGAGTDPVTGARIELPPLGVEPLGGGVYGFAGGLLMSQRIDFPQPGIARAGWIALPRADA